MIEVQVHPADVTRTARFFFLKARHLRLLLFAAVPALAVVGYGISQAPRVAEGVWLAWKVAREERVKRDLRQERAALQARERETRQRLQHAAQELRRFRLILGLEPFSAAGGKGEGDLQNWARALEEEAEALVAFSRKQAELFASLPAICPVERGSFAVSSRFGLRVSPFTGAMEFHKGLDFAAPEGLPVRATGQGVVVFAGRVGTENPPWARLGNVVVLSHGERYFTVYAHLSRVLAQPGQKLRRGEVVGEVGSTGWSTAPHLHYEVRRWAEGELVPVDPAFFLLDYPMASQELAMGGAGTMPLDLLASEKEVLPWRKTSRYPR